MSSTKPSLNWTLWGLPTPSDEGDWVTGSCPKCHTRAQEQATVLIHPESGNFHCELCGYHGNARIDPRRFRDALSFHPSWLGPFIGQAALPWLNSQGLSLEIAQKSGVHTGTMFFETTQQWESGLAFPVFEKTGQFPVDIWHLSIQVREGTFKDLRQTPGGKNLPWGWNTIDPDCVVFVDHPMDRLALLESGCTSVACIPSGLDPQSPSGESWSFLSLIENDLRLCKKIVFAMPDNNRGRDLEDELARRFGLEHCFRVRWPQTDTAPISGSDEKPKDSVQQNHGPAQSAQEKGALVFLQTHGADALFQQIETAVPFPISGVYELYDVDDRFEALYEFGLPSGVLTGFPSLNTNYTVMPGQWTLVTGIPGHGKSNFLDALLVNIARDYDWRFGMFSPENQPIERHFASLMEKIAEAPFNEGPTPRITPEAKNKYKHWLNEHFKILLPDDEQGNWSVDGVLALARTLVYRYGIRGLVIDPWNELDHTRPTFMSETEHISASLTKIRRFARTHGVHIWVVAHPTKLEPKADGAYPVPTPYNVSGGAHWRNKADNSITVFRFVGEEDEDISDIHVQKIRFKEVGRVGVVSLRYDRRNGCYYDDIDQRKRSLSLSNGKHTPSSDIRVARRTKNEGMILHHSASPDTALF